MTTRSPLALIAGALTEIPNTDRLAVPGLWTPPPIRKAATESVTSSTTFQDDDELLFAVAASEGWGFLAVLFVDGAEAGDIDLTFEGPAGSSGTWGGAGPTSGTTADSNTSSRYSASALGASKIYGTRTSATPMAILAGGSVANGATPGSLKLRWTQGASNGTATRVLAGSILVPWRVS